MTENNDLYLQRLGILEYETSRTRPNDHRAQAHVTAQGLLDRLTGDRPTNNEVNIVDPPVDVARARIRQLLQERRERRSRESQERLTRELERGLPFFQRMGRQLGRKIDKIIDKWRGRNG